MLTGSSRAWGAALLVLLFAWTAGAHTRGLSRCTFEIASDGAVHGRLELAIADLPERATETEAGLSELALRGVDVRADGESCPGRFADSRADGADGVAIDLDFRCPAGASVIEAELFFIPDVGGQSVASLEMGSKTKQVVLDAAHRTVQMQIAPKKPARARVALWVIGAAILVALAAAFALARRRRRPTPNG